VHILAMLALLSNIASGPAADQVAIPSRHADNYLHNLDLAEEQAANEAIVRTAAGVKPSGLLGALQGLATSRAKLGDTQGALAAFSQKGREEEKFYGTLSIGNESSDLAAIDGSHSEDAVDAIARAARSRQIVILNEAHHVPFDRVFAMHLARALRTQGFEYLACETFFIDDEHVLNKGYVVDKTGVYSREPTYAKFLMDARENGWKFVSYEPLSGPRESGMAKNLVSRIFLSNPKAKVFIYAGYAHAKKLPVSHSDDDHSELAAQLLRRTGVEPLTINQTTLFAQYNTAQQARYYEHAVRKLKTRLPGVLMNARGNPIQLSIDGKAYDFEVVHPRYVDSPATRRPEWLSADFRPRDIPVDIVHTKTRRAVYAYLRDTAPDAVPLDVVVLDPGKPAPKLMLPAGDFVFEYEDASP
jgi:hypothetical protein